MDKQKVALLIDHPNPSFVLSIVGELIRRRILIDLVVSFFPQPALISVLGLTRAYRPIDFSSRTTRNRRFAPEQNFAPTWRETTPSLDSQNPTAGESQEQNAREQNAESFQNGQWDNGVWQSGESQQVDQGHASQFLVNGHQHNINQQERPTDLENLDYQIYQFNDIAGIYSAMPNLDMFQVPNMTEPLFRERQSYEDATKYYESRRVNNARPSARYASPTFMERVKGLALNSANAFSRWTGFGLQKRLAETIQHLIQSSLATDHDREQRRSLHQLLQSVYQEEAYAPELLLIGKRHDHTIQEWQSHLYRYAWFRPNTLKRYVSNWTKHDRHPELMSLTHCLFSPISESAFDKRGKGIYRFRQMEELFFAESYSQALMALGNHSQDVPLEVPIEPIHRTKEPKTISLTGWWDQIPWKILYKEIEHVYGPRTKRNDWQVLLVK